REFTRATREKKSFSGYRSRLLHVRSLVGFSGTPGFCFRCCGHHADLVFHLDQLLIPTRDFMLHVECAEHPVSVVRHPLGTVDSPSCYGECCGISVFGSPVALCGGALVAEHPSWFPLLLLYMGGCSPREGNLPGRNLPEDPAWKVVV